MEIASVSATLSRQIGYQAPDKAYCLGLFHNCGVPLMMKEYPNYQEIVQESYSGCSSRVIDVENQHFKTNHAVVGYYVAKSWGLPHDLCEVIAEHHNVVDIFCNPNIHYDGAKKTLLAILKMAEHLCGVYEVIAHQPKDYEWNGIKQEVLAFVGFSELDFDDLVTEMENMGISGAAYHDHSA